MWTYLSNCVLNIISHIFNAGMATFDQIWLKWHFVIYGVHGAVQEDELRAAPGLLLFFSGQETELFLFSDSQPRFWGRSDPSQTS